MRLLSAFAVFLLTLSGLASAGGFDDAFTGATMRVDYMHCGTADEEHFARERVLIEGPWPGSRTRLIDSSNLGKYLVEVADLSSHQVLYSRGFCSIYGEWETTGEARTGVFRCIPEAVRVPEPRRPVQVRLRKRGDDQSFTEVWTTTIDPASRFVARPPSRQGTVTAILEHGEPAVKVDLLVLGDGYTAAQMAKFHADARRLIGVLFEHEPYASRRDDFNVWMVDTPATHAGISRPRAGVFRDSPLGASYNSFDSERYVLSLDDRRWRDAAAAAPYDFVLILVNEKKYGGGGIHNLYATSSVDSAFSSYVVVHELGHHIAGLGDEYFTSAVAYEDFAGSAVEPWELNITALVDPSTLKWKDLVDADTPLPTPWDRDAYIERSRELQERRRALRAEGKTEEEVERLFFEERRLFTRMLADEDFAGTVGAFEGAMYAASGLYRPTVDCIMFTRDEVGFCPVCRRALDMVFDMYTR
jgi:hypothetical protein